MGTGQSVVGERAAQLGVRVESYGGERGGGVGCEASHSYLGDLITRA